MPTTTPIIGSIVERKATKGPAVKAPSGTSLTGFPTVQHRSKSAFARSREESQRRDLNGGPRPDAPPVVKPTKPLVEPSLQPVTAGPLTVSNDHDTMREQISRENEVLIAGMSPEEIEEERRQIIERFGGGIEGILDKARRNRMKRASESQFVGISHPRKPVVDTDTQEVLKDSLQSLAEVPISPEERKPVERAQSPPPPALSTASTRPPSRSENRRLRFAELEPKDVFVYESTPPSPRRPILALPPPPDLPDSSVVSLGRWQGQMPNPSAVMEPQVVPTPDQQPSSDLVEEGTPEDIRRRYFPNVPADDPNLEWIKGSSEDKNDDSIRFDLRGAPIPPELSSKLPTHLGLHHHAEGSHAGYTLDDVFLLTRSTVPGQRTAMFGVLSGVCDRLSKLAHGEDVEGMEGFKGKEEELRKRIAAAGAEAINERGNVGIQAVDVVWRSIADWDRELISLALEGSMLESAADETVRSLPLDYLLPSIAAIFKIGREAYPPETFKQLLEVTQRLAVHNADFAAQIAQTNNLLLRIVQHFIVTPVPRPEQEGLLPDPAAIILLTSLARASRQVAEAISKAFADVMLRFLALLPGSSPYPPSLSLALITSTLDLYATLGAYGLASNIASIAMEQFTNLSRYVCSLEEEAFALSSSWLALVQVWTTCAIDPHATTPPHDITWSRVAAWAYHMDVLQLVPRLGFEIPAHWRVWGKLFGVLAAWLEGAKVNGLKGGESERDEFLGIFSSDFANEQGRSRQVVDKALTALQAEVSKSAANFNIRDAAAAAIALSNVLRVWLACVPSHYEGPPERPPFDLPYERISSVVAALLCHPLWIALSRVSDRHRVYGGVHVRELSILLTTYLRLSRRLPDTSLSLWLAQAFSIVLRCLPGDEDIAVDITSRIAHLCSDQAGQPSTLEPFVENAILPRPDAEDIDNTDENYLIKPRERISPLIVTAQSIRYTTTVAIPSPFATKTKTPLSGLPLRSNWMLTPLNHLLRSGDSTIFKHLPTGWNYSELDITRSSLALALKARQSLWDWKLSQFSLQAGEAILACMEVFMLEHGLADDKGRTSENEVFRDPVVESLMGKLVGPYRHSVASQSSPTPYSSNLETLATSFLGAGTPFYQFFTDFLGLYDAISFSHPLFGQLLLPPISMRYAIDYRRLFWCDYSHIHRTVAVYPNQVLSADLREYLYPIESDAQVIGGFLSSLLKSTANEFLRWVAIHHVASNIWTDLRKDEEDGPWNQDRAVKLLQAVVTQGNTETVAAIAKYIQPPRQEAAQEPTDVMALHVDAFTSRKQWVESVIGGAVVKKLNGLL